MKEELEIIQTEGIEVYQSDEKAAIDVQVATAKQHPRNIKRAVDNSIAIVTMDKETAETCTYSLPRGGKKINGPSVHLARIIAQNWQNLRVESKVVNITQTQVVSEAVCFDLETNYAVKVQVRKNILQNEYDNGRQTGRKIRMNDDMITVTGNASNAVAYRNAVFAVIPKAVTDKVYSAAKNMITGDLSDEQKLLKRRKAVLDGFKDNYNVTEDQILEALGLNSINQIKQDEIVNLIGLAQAIKDGDTTVSDTFGTTKKAEQKKTAEMVNGINQQLKKVIDKKEKKEAKPTEEKRPEKLQFATESEARKFFETEMGIMPENLVGKKLFETAKELDTEFEIVPKDGKLL